MRIVESQSAVLSNYEVYRHLEDQRHKYKRNKRRGPPNLETVVRELLQYLRTKPSPHGQKKPSYSPACVAQLIERLQPYELSKGEVLMILNLRPASIAALNTVVEDMAERFSDEQQEEMVEAVAQVLGQFGPEDEEPGAAAANGEDADVTMDDNAAAS